jgi:hypothetical protein
LIGGVVLLAASLYARQWVAAAIVGLALQGIARERLGLTWRKRWSKTQRFVADILVLLLLMAIAVASPGYVDLYTVGLALLVTLGWLVWRIRKLQTEE